MAKKVYSKNELKKALKDGEKEIYVYGEAAKKLAKLNGNKRLIPLLGGLGAAGLSALALSILAAPISGGASLSLGLPFVSYAVMNIGEVGVSLSATEVMIIATLVAYLGVKFIVEICTKYEVITIDKGDLEIKLERKR